MSDWIESLKKEFDFLIQSQLFPIGESEGVKKSPLTDYYFPEK